LDPSTERTDPLNINPNNKVVVINKNTPKKGDNLQLNLEQQPQTFINAKTVGCFKINRTHGLTKALVHIGVISQPKWRKRCEVTNSKLYGLGNPPQNILERTPWRTLRIHPHFLSSRRAFTTSVVAVIFPFASVLSSRMETQLFQEFPPSHYFYH
jgi:hypothetical protein